MKYNSTVTLEKIMQETQKKIKNHITQVKPGGL